MTPLPVLHTPRLTLTILAERDREDVIAAWIASDTHLGPWSPRPPEGWSRDALFSGTLARAVNGFQEGTQYRFVARDADGRVAGWFSLSEVVRGAFWNAYASWSVTASHAGRGLATEGVGALLEFAFAPSPAGIGLHRVQANVIPENGPSLRLAERLGFRYEGLARAYLRIDGAWRDHRTYAMLAEEYAVGTDA